MNRFQRIATLFCISISCLSVDALQNKVTVQNQQALDVDLKLAKALEQGETSTAKLQTLVSWIITKSDLSWECNLQLLLTAHSFGLHDIQEHLLATLTHLYALNPTPSYKKQIATLPAHMQKNIPALVSQSDILRVFLTSKAYPFKNQEILWSTNGTYCVQNSAHKCLYKIIPSKNANYGALTPIKWSLSNQNPIPCSIKDPNKQWNVVIECNYFTIQKNKHILCKFPYGVIAVAISPDNTVLAFTENNYTFFVDFEPSLFSLTVDQVDLLEHMITDETKWGVNDSEVYATLPDAWKTRLGKPFENKEEETKIVEEKIEQK